MVKQRILTSIFIIFVSFTVSAQSPIFKKLYGKIEGGYGFFTPGAYKASTAIALPRRDSATNSQSNQGLGGGFRLGLGVGFVQNDFINFGIDAEYTNQKGIKDRSSIILDTLNYATDDQKINYSFVTITPHVIFKALAKPKFFLYNKLGFLFTLPFKLKSQDSELKVAGSISPREVNFYNGIVYPNSVLTQKMTDLTTTDLNYKMSLGIGLNVAFGINYKINDKVRAFGEIFGNYSSLSPKTSVTNNNFKSTITNRIDTANFLLEESIKELSEYVYFSDYIQASQSGVSSTEIASQDLGVNAEGFHVTRTTLDQKNLKRTLDLTVIGINVGIIYRF